MCDYSTGNCACADGYGGAACEVEHTAYSKGVNARVYEQVIPFLFTF